MPILEQYGEAETRRGFGDALYELGKQNQKVVALAADLAESIRMDKFMKAFPERFFQCGVAEANMVSVAAGLTIGGYSFHSPGHSPISLQGGSLTKSGKAWHIQIKTLNWLGRTPGLH